MPSNDLRLFLEIVTLRILENLIFLTLIWMDFLGFNAPIYIGKQRPKTSESKVT